MADQKHTVAWFSAGVSSAVAIKLVIDEIDSIVYVHIDDQHEDTLRFVDECESWFGRAIIRIQHPEFKSVEAVVRKKRYINGVAGAACTRLLKRGLREEYIERECHGKAVMEVWGMDASEAHRAKRLIDSSNCSRTHKFPLIERNIGKAEAHQILRTSGIRRPRMYELGYRNNNCIGCLKGGMGYWNRIRRDFPDVFAARAKLERDIGATCINGVWLDELSPRAGRNDPPIDDECGFLCESMKLEWGGTSSGDTGPAV